MSLLFTVSFVLPFVFAGAEEISEAPFIPEGVTDSLLIIDYSMGVILPLFMLIPLMVSSILGAHSFVTEKLSKTLEPLLASPITDNELFIGKILAILIPVLIMTYVGIIISLIGVNIITLTSYQAFYWPTITWLVGVIFIMPLISFIGVNFAILISSKAKDQQTAQQLTGIIALPLVALMMASIMGAFLVNLESIITIIGLLIVIAYLLFKASTKSFNHEGIITKWT
jgi:ABC-type Na+ efflux pump permease subunit